MHLQLAFVVGVAVSQCKTPNRIRLAERRHWPAVENRRTELTPPRPPTADVCQPTTNQARPPIELPPFPPAAAYTLPETGRN